MEEPITLGLVTLSREQEDDVRALLSWAFTAKPGIPFTRTLGDLWSELSRRDRELHTPQAER